jgi:copper chaperone CopZ
MNPRFTRAQPCAAAMTVATAILCGCASTPTTDANATPLSSPAALPDGHYTLVVNGMSCPKCISNVEMQLTRIGGVTHPLVDMKNGFVTIDIVGGKTPSRESIAGAIADAGFTLVDVRGGVE